jgi:hypothetical protein
MTVRGEDDQEQMQGTWEMKLDDYGENAASEIEQPEQEP